MTPVDRMAGQDLALGDASASGTRPGFWCERITYRSLAVDSVTSMATYATTNPAQAIRRIRVEVRVLASSLPPREMARAFAWANERGCLGALAALHRGEPCGLSLNRADAWVEWTVRPVRFLSVCPTGGLAACLIPTATGRGPSTSGSRRT
ncbi:hypothetical protein ACFVT5_27980 [Streptomyces sp. NPDC058001]|uniref:hypothetical protein n=1 Tax=Streptomyces sp. NPDC058001 TaxID=3346300 RepID=UPI0036EC669A